MNISEAKRKRLTQMIESFKNMSNQYKETVAKAAESHKAFVTIKKVLNYNNVALDTVETKLLNTYYADVDKTIIYCKDAIDKSSDKLKAITDFINVLEHDDDAACIVFDALVFLGKEQPFVETDVKATETKDKEA